MKRIRLSRSLCVVLALALVATLALTVAPEAMAQLGGQPTKSPPTPTSSDKPPLLIQYGVLVVLAMGVIGLSIFKSKREVRG